MHGSSTVSLTKSARQTKEIKKKVGLLCRLLHFAGISRRPCFVAPAGTMHDCSIQRNCFVLSVCHFIFFPPPPAAYGLSARARVHVSCLPRQVGVKSRFVGYGEGAACTVENLVLQHLSQSEEGSWAGWHCEGSPLRALWALLMWDVIFSPVDDVFQVFSPYRARQRVWCCSVNVALSFRGCCRGRVMLTAKVAGPRGAVLQQ